MSQTKLEFLNMMMNDPGMRQRNKNAQDRRRECERLWDEKQEAVDEAEPEPEAEAEVVTETDDPGPAEDDEAGTEAEEEEAPDLDDAPAP